MSVTAQQRSLLRSVEEYSRLLENVSEEEFQRSPGEGIWCYAQVYSHIFQANLGSLIATEKCINGTAEINSDRLNWITGLILLFGRFPPGKFKAPASIASMVSIISREEARNMIVKFNNRIDYVAPRVSKSSAAQKIKHPRLGLLNAQQWFRFIQIHTLHHQKQLQRIGKLLKQSA